MMWTGVCDQKNGLGTLTSAAIFFLIWSVIRRWTRKEKPAFRYQTLVDGVIIVASLWLLKGPGSYSATAVVVLAIGLLSLLGLQVLKLFHKTLNPMILTALVLLIVVYGTVAPFIGRLPAADISARLGRDSSLTGRNEIWASVVPAAKNKPLLGHGFYSFSARKISRLYANAHNGYLEVILGIGFAGLLLTALYLLSSIRRAQRELRTDYLWGSYWIGWLLMVMLNNVTESTLHSFSSLLTAVLMWLTIAHGHLQEQKGEND
jgi:O-antigen ligase